MDATLAASDRPGPSREHERFNQFPDYGDAPCEARMSDSHSKTSMAVPKTHDARRFNRRDGVQIADKCGRRKAERVHTSDSSAGLARMEAAENCSSQQLQM